MKKHLAIIIGAIILVLAIVGGVGFWLTHRSFRLDAQFYGDGTIAEIDIPELESLIDQKSSFLLFAYQSSCSTSEEFAKVLQDFVQQYSVGMLTTSFTTLKQSRLVEDLKYYPSAIIYHDGAVVKFLDADSNVDLPAYESVDGFVKWLTENHVQLD